ACLKLLATLPEVPNDTMVGVEQMKAQCRMASGDCVGGTAALRKLGKAQGWDEGRINTIVDAADRSYCPITAEPKSRWGERAQQRLLIAGGTGRSCKVVLDTIHKHNIVLPDPKQGGFMEVQCMVNAGDCAGARGKYIQLLSPTDP